MAICLAREPIVIQIGGVRRHKVTLSEPLSELIRAQVKSGRYTDFSAALQDAGWHFFIGPPTPFQEYGVTPEEVERAAQRDLAAIRRDRKAGKLKRWKPGA